MLLQHTPKNIALKLPYPKIEKTVPHFLTPDQYNRLICHFSEWADSSIGLRNLIIIMLYITTNQDLTPFTDTIHLRATTEPAAKLRQAFRRRVEGLVSRHSLSTKLKPSDKLQT